MNRFQVMALTAGALVLAACASTSSINSSDNRSDSKQAVETTGWDRLPASEASGPLPRGAHMRVVKSIKLEPIKVHSKFGAYFVDGRSLARKEVQELITRNTAQIMEYCVLYTDRNASFSLKEGETHDLKEVPPSLHWEPGYLYAVTGSKDLKAVGCFSLSESAGSDVTERQFQNHLNGVLEIN